MERDVQNSAGFLQTRSVSTEILIPEVANFEFSPTQVEAFSDDSLNIPERLMLGKRAERYFSEWIKRSSEYELIAQNIQVIDQKRTLGEFDFILQKTSNEQLIHVELVYKFYLFDSTAGDREFEQWIGPNKKDRLDYKLHKLSDHQFPLLFHESAKAKLSELTIDTDRIEQRVLFLANLFVPLDVDVSFNKVNKNAVEGTWMTLAKWEQTFASSIRFAIPPKTNWFAQELNSDEWLTKEQAREAILSLHNQRRSPLVYSTDVTGNQRRDFVVWW